jgi:hypothetical protein
VRGENERVMAAKIVKLFGDGGPVVCRPINIRFPKLYRMTGRRWAMVDGRPVATDEPAPAIYTLVEGCHSPHAGPSWAEIEHLDEMLDAGWIVIRHHRTRERAEGYIDALVDLVPDDDTVALYQTDAGLFTITVRQPTEGRPDCLVVYHAEVPLPGDRFGDGWNCWSKVVSPDGSELDESVLFPREDC